jgi:hypothetical protein
MQAALVRLSVSPRLVSSMEEPLYCTMVESQGEGRGEKGTAESKCGKAVRDNLLDEKGSDGVVVLVLVLRWQDLISCLGLASFLGFFVYARLISQSRGSIPYRAWC